MGYTHYWYRPRELDAERFSAWTADVRRILENLPAQRQDRYGFWVRDASRSKHEMLPLVIAGPHGTGQPEVTANAVAFNGTVEGDLWHESFSVERVFSSRFEQSDENGWLFDFCKTAQKPYDL